MNKVDLPEKLKSSKTRNQLKDGIGLITVTKSLMIKGYEKAYVEVSFDDEQKVIDSFLFGVSDYDSSTSLISAVPNTVMSPYDECEDKPSNAGVILCVANRIADKIISWF